MSEWIVCRDKDHVSLSGDGKSIELLFEQNDFGNVYIEIPVEFILKVLPNADKDKK